ncbi:MAG TPA: hypothetical protein VFG81_10060 [Anaerolineales bacterium]|nr:hypothetical protein [Anaerolineales bacterium]
MTRSPKLGPEALPDGAAGGTLGGGGNAGFASTGGTSDSAFSTMMVPVSG